MFLQCDQASGTGQQLWRLMLINWEEIVQSDPYFHAELGYFCLVCDASYG